MKIAIITPYRNFYGGVEVVNSFLYKIFTKQSYTVDFITIDGFKPNFLDKLAIKFFGKPYITAKIFNNRSKVDQYDVVICNGEYGLFINHHNSIILFHGSYAGYRNSIKSKIKLLPFLSLTRSGFIQKMAAKNKTVVAVSNYLSGILLQQGIKVDHVIQNCVELDRSTDLLKSSKISKKGLFIGSYDYWGKGFDILENIADLGYRIDVISKGYFGDKFKKIENLSNNELTSIYCDYDFVLFPSRFEGLGLVPIEALACGTPVLMSNVGFGTDLMKISPEYVFNIHQPREAMLNEIVEKLDVILTSKNENIKNISELIKENFSVSRFEKKWCDLIENM